MSDRAEPATDPLLALAERVEQSTGDIGDLILEAGRALNIGNPKMIRLHDLWSCGAYLDAVSALQEAVLPGWRIYRISEEGSGWTCIINRVEGRESRFVHAPTEPAARLAALLRAVAMERRTLQGDQT